ncbi:SAC3/GANP/Nin1/mts3/eIF-3 p25 family-domain-containing protein [Chytriomyces cf. hyalinus JEL632]|nr:SAC3/GANP/Nin1/mts3/eIF-3 p25 family-domain-containing protein [Chytriomyces cf. hyalinus JEL632]
MKSQRDALKEKYIREGKILADDAKVSLNDAVSLVGECLDMCPEFERHEREYQRGLHPLEKIPGTELVDHQRAVKRYRRSASDGHTLLPCDVRPPHILIKTLDYLFHTVIAEHGLQESQPFVRDRTRGIRNDFTLQNYRQMEAIVCHERIARYHIVVASQLIAHEGFSLQQEMEQIRKTLQSLREYYTDMRKESIPCPNEAEFQAYYILSHIWNNDIATLAETLPFHIFNDPRVQLALEFQHLAQCSTAPVFKGMKRSLGSLSYYTRFFAKVADTHTSYLVAALLHQEFDRVRCNALRSMNRVLWDLEPRVSLLELAALLGYNDEQEVATVLEYYEVKVEETMEGEWVACLGKDPPTKNSKLKSKTFQDGKRVSLQPRPSIRLVGSKAAGVQIQDIIDGFDVGVAKPVPSPDGICLQILFPMQNRCRIGAEIAITTLNGQLPIIIKQQRCFRITHFQQVTTGYGRIETKIFCIRWILCVWKFSIWTESSWREIRNQSSKSNC